VVSGISGLSGLTGWGGIGVNDPAEAYIQAHNAFAASISAALLTEAEKTVARSVTAALRETTVWDKQQAIYLLLGGDSRLRGLNLKDPRPVNAAFYMQFSGTWHVDANGLRSSSFNPSVTPFVPPTAFANTSYSPAAHMTAASAHITMAFAGNNAAGNQTELYVPGPSLSYPQNPRLQMSIKRANNNFFCNAFSTGAAGTTNSLATISNFNSNGVFTLSRIAANDLRAYRNGVVVHHVTETETEPPPGRTILIIPGIRPLGFVSIGQGLTPTEVAQLSTIAADYQVARGRTVAP
jgi:hypothetical protein